MEEDIWSGACIKKASDPKYYDEWQVQSMINAVNYPRPKGRELLVFASTEPLVLTQQNRAA